MKRRTENIFSPVEKEKKRKTENEPDEAEQENTPIAKERQNYQLYYRFEKKNNEKIGICRECAKKNLHKELKMKNCNTTGLKKHLQVSHPLIYQTMFGLTIAKKSDQVLKQQSTLEDMLINVSILLNIFSYTLVVNFIIYSSS